MKTICIIILITYLNSCISKKYYNYTLYRALPFTNEDVKFLLNLSEAYNANFWRYPSHVNRPAEFVIPPDMKERFLQRAELQSIYLTTIIEDVQR